MESRKILKKAAVLIMSAAIFTGSACGFTGAGESFAAKKVPLKKIVLNKSAVTVKKGNKIKLSVKYKPKNTTVKKKVVWKSSKPGVASVKKGTVTARKAGKTVITAKVGKKKARCTVTVKAKAVVVHGEYVDASRMYDLLNDFRTASGVWYWNEDDTTKTYFNTDDTVMLKPLARDEALEKTARVRAKELVEKYDHIRPDGTSCFTAFPEGLYTAGENVTAGQTDVSGALESWKETNCSYSNQGHRRNMLYQYFNSVGIAGYKINGVIYWVQAFGYRYK